MRNKKSKKERAKGAVTLFLTLVLVPCIIFACAFGDASRVQLSKSQATSAADLALYSLMANYDEKLKDFYGLVASCQDIDQYYEKAGKYFTGMLTANGVDDFGSKTFTSYLSGLMKNGDYSNFLSVELLGDVSVGPAENGVLGENPALIEQGVVEFMKYRGPYEITTKLIDRFKHLNVLGGLSDADKDKPITEAKQDTAEAEGKMLEDMLYTYLAVQTYQNTYNKTPGLALNEFINTYPEALDRIREDFVQITELITNYYAFRNQIQNLSGSIVSYGELPTVTDTQEVLDYADLTISKAGIGASKKDDGYKIDETALQNILKNKDQYVSDLKTASNNIVNACQGITRPSTDPDINEVVYIVRTENAFTSNSMALSTVRDRGKSLMQMYAKILLAEKCELPEAAPGEKSWSTKLAEAKSQLADIHKNYLTCNTPSTDYERIVSEYKNRVGTVLEDLEHGRYQEFDRKWAGSEWVGAKVTIGTYLVDVRETFQKLDKTISDQIKTIDTIINGGTINWKGTDYKVVSLEKLKAEIRDYRDKREIWGAEADAGTTKYAEKEQDEYHNPTEKKDSPVGQAMLDLKDKDVDEFKTRMTNIKNDLKKFQDALNNFKYGGKKVSDISGRDECISLGMTKISSDVNSVNIKVSANKQLSKSYYDQLMSPLTGTIYTAPSRTSGKTGNNPDLSDKADMPTLYDVMTRTIKPDQLDEVANKKKENDKATKDAKDKAKKEADSSKGLDEGFLSDLGKDPSGEHSGGGMNVGTLLSSSVSAVQKIVGGNITSFRDQLYVVEYCMDMFSYSSFNNEGQYHLNKGDPYVFTHYSKEQKGFPEQIKAWSTDEKTDLYENQSLTNQHISSALNYSNLAEVEYVLYGKSTNEGNLTAMYNDIFVIREALNLISGFQNFYSGGNTTAIAINSAALAVQAATCGVVPIPLTKCVIIGVLATIESAHDLNRLKAGVPVVLYKTEPERWWAALPSGAQSISALTNADWTKFTEPEDSDLGLYYSDYLYIFMCVAANSPSTYNKMLLRIGDLIESNMKLMAKNDAYDLGKSVCFFNIGSEVRVKPLFLTLPIVNSMDGVDATVVTESTDWCTYKIKTVRGYS